MSRNEFMTKLEQLLSDISENEREEALKYYNDYFNDAGEENEQDVISALGTPEQVAETVKEGISDNKSEASNADSSGQLSADTAATSGNTDFTADNTNTSIPPQPKKSLPAWAIVLIIIGCLLAVSIVIGTIITIKTIRFAKATGEKAIEIIEERGPEIREIIESLPEGVIISDSIQDAIGNSAISDEAKDIIMEEFDGVLDDVKEYIPDSDTSISEDPAAELTQISASDVNDLDVKFGAGVFVINEKDTDDGLIDIYVIERGKSKCRISTEEDMTLCITAAQNVKASDLKKKDSLNRVEVRIPKDFSFNEVELDLGACTSNVSAIKAKEIDAGIGAGELTMSNIAAEEFTLDVGAGTASVNEATVNESTVKVGLGKADFSGSIIGDMSMDVGMGVAQFNLSGSETNHNYIVDCAMGAVKIGDLNAAGLAKAKDIDNGASSTFDIDCGMGSVEINFN